MRAAPNMRGTVLDQVHAGEIVELLGRSADGNWLYIRNPRGQVGWTHRTLLSLTTGVDEHLVLDHTGFFEYPFLHKILCGGKEDA